MIPVIATESVKKVKVKPKGAPLVSLQEHRLYSEYLKVPMEITTTRNILHNRAKS
jgi:hypothetical protein